jgi:diguanylate cyclase (GGDEF)-like protein
MRFGAFVAGSLLVGFSAFSAYTSGRARERVAFDAVLASEARERSDAIMAYFERARVITLVTAHNPGFAGFYSSPGERLSKIDPEDLAVAQAKAAMAYLESIYPTAIEEICFIDTSGAENARLVKRVAAPAAQLDPDESKNEFFASTIRLGPDEVYQGRPYLSPDTGQWVISNSTMIAAPDGTRPAMVHFEITFDSFRVLNDHQHADLAYLIVDRTTGTVISNSRVPQHSDAVLGLPTDHRFDALAAGAMLEGLMTVGESRAAVRRVTTSANNSNDWYVVAVGDAPSPGLFEGFGPTVIASLVAAVFLIGFALASARGNRRRLQLAASTDPLTSLPNRSVLADRVTAALVETRSMAALMLLDLDRFKEVNDTLGHRYGDAILTAIGPRIQSVLGPKDTVARLGGDEFAVLIASVTSTQAALDLARVIQVRLGEPFAIDDLSLVVEASIGVALAPTHGRTFDQLLQYADVAMYAAKGLQTGVELYDVAIDKNSTERLSLLSDVRRGLDRGEFELVYQQKRTLGDDQLAGYEALLRWRHPTRGLLTPADFVTIVEQSALIGPVTEWVLDEAARQSAIWLQEGIALPISANVSARSMSHPGFAEMVRAAVQRHGVPESLLVIEVTETTLMDDSPQARANLAKLAEYGIELSIDDFGTGYSSLAYLAHLATIGVNEVKIDQSFVVGMLSNSNAEMIVTSVIELGHNLGLRVVAEGVEDAETRDRLIAIGCDHAQGYLWGSPLRADECTASMVAQARASRAESANGQPDRPAGVPSLIRTDQD